MFRPEITANNIERHHLDMDELIPKKKRSNFGNQSNEEHPSFEMKQFLEQFQHSNEETSSYSASDSPDYLNPDSRN